MLRRVRRLTTRCVYVYDRVENIAGNNGPAAEAGTAGLQAALVELQVQQREIAAMHHHAPANLGGSQFPALNHAFVAVERRVGGAHHTRGPSCATNWRRLASQRSYGAQQMQTATKSSRSCCRACLGDAGLPSRCRLWTS